MTEAAASCDSVLEAAIALYRHEIDEDQFVAALVALPIVQQSAMPRPPGLIEDAWLPWQGPISDLRHVHSARLISNAAYDRALDAMGDAGHRA